VVLVRMRTWLCGAVGDLRVCLGTADIGRCVEGDLRGSLGIGPNRARIGLVHRRVVRPSLAGGTWAERNPSLPVIPTCTRTGPQLTVDKTHILCHSLQMGICHWIRLSQANLAEHMDNVIEQEQNGQMVGWKCKERSDKGQ
jgi:hypothetical protein